MDPLAGRTILGFGQLFVVLALALFGPAWTLSFWQAWVYLFVFAACTFPIAAYLWKSDRKLLERRVNAGPQAEKERLQVILQIALSFTFLAFFVVASLDHRFSWSRVPPALELLGDALVASGFLAVFFVLKENSFAAGAIEVAPDQRVISTGPYAIVRHPMYAGALIMLFGTPLALGSFWSFVPFVLTIGVLVARLLDEETFLAKNLPGYDDYRREVRRRLVPLVW
jgi:protein-S-isoprenylcysteine O-methyltransferase Ste14